MIERAPLVKTMQRVAVAGAVVALTLTLSGCADMGGDAWTSAFVDPATYELYDCKQLEVARKTLAARQAELQGLMAKAQTATGGAVVSELAYRNDYVSVRGQVRLADEVWRKNNCHETPAATPVADASPTPNAKPAKGKPAPNLKLAPPSQSGSAVY